MTERSFKGAITHAFLDVYALAQGEPERVPGAPVLDMELWEVVDGLMLDLHLERHGYADEGYSRHLERELQALCAETSVVDRLRALRF